MLTYITAFIFYTLAMVGVLLVGFVIYKKTILPIKSEQKGLIKVIDSLNIAPKKTLLVIKVKNEKFLIASDSERTSLISKLENDSKEASTLAKIAAQELESLELEDEQEPQQPKKQTQNEIKSPFTFNEVKEEKPNRKEMIRMLLKDLSENK